MRRVIASNNNAGTLAYFAFVNKKLFTFQVRGGKGAFVNCEEIDLMPAIEGKRVVSNPKPPIIYKKGL